MGFKLRGFIRPRGRWKGLHNSSIRVFQYGFSQYRVDGGLYNCPLSQKSHKFRAQGLDLRAFVVPGFSGLASSCRGSGTPLCFTEGVPVRFPSRYCSMKGC